MEIKLQNFGKIQDAEVKLDGLTLIAGKNDTGKSTVGKALFSIISSLKEYPDEFEKIKIERFYKEHFGKLYQFSQREVSDEQLKNEIGNLKPFSPMPDSVPSKEKIKKVLVKMRSAVTEDIKKDIKNALEFLADTESEVEKINEISRRAFALTFFGNLNNSVHKGDIATVDYKHGDKKILSYKIKSNKLETSFEVKNLGMSFNDVVFIDNPYVLENWKKPNSKYTDDLLKKKKLATKKLLVESFYENILKEFENVFNGGEFIESNERLKYKVNDDSDELEIHNIASGTKSFGLLYVLLKTGMIGKDSLIILDEPENHLHPAWQIKYAEIICKMVKDGFTFLITSHSSDFIQAIKFYSNKFDIMKNKTNFYLAERKNNTNYSNIIETTNDTSKIFKNLIEPFDAFVKGL